MNHRNAILQAAAHIERHPECYSFMTNRIPKKPDDFGCALGWINHFQIAAMPWWQKALRIVRDPLMSDQVSPQLLGIGKELGQFFAAVSASQPDNLHWLGGSGERVPKVLRRFANHRYPISTRDVIPINVRAIFETKQTEAAIQSFL